MENVRKHRDNKHVTTEARRKYLVFELNYHTTNLFSENLLPIEVKKKQQILTNKLVYLGLSVLETSKIVMHEFWYDDVNPIRQSID